MTTPIVPELFDKDGKKLTPGEIHAIVQVIETTYAVVKYELRDVNENVLQLHSIVLEGITADTVDHITIVDKTTRVQNEGV